MDHQRFDNVTRRLASTTNRRSSIRTLLGGLIGIGAAVSGTSVDARRKRCPAERACGRSCCRREESCVFNRCQQTQNGCVSYGRCYDPNVCCLHHYCNPYQYCEFCGQDALCSSGGDCCDPAFPVCSGGRCAAQ